MSAGSVSVPLTPPPPASAQPKVSGWERFRAILYFLPDLIWNKCPAWFKELLDWLLKMTNNLTPQFTRITLALIGLVGLLIISVGAVSIFALYLTPDKFWEFIFFLVGKN